MSENELKPSPIALVVCDNIYSEPTGKVALVGLFNNISARQFPASHPRLVVFVSLTGVRKGMTGKLDIVHSETDNPIVEARGGFDQNVGPTDIVDMSFILNNVTFPEPGMYYIRFFGNGHPLLMRPFVVGKSTRPAREEPEA